MDSNTTRLISYNHTEEEAQIHNYDGTPFVIILSVLFILIVTGNVIVITFIFRKKNGQTRLDILYVNTACADLSVALFLVLSDIIWKSTYEWKAGNIMCKVMRFLWAWSSYSSTFALVALSIDRLIAIYRPMQHIRRGKNCKLLIGCVWITSFLCSIEMPVLHKEYKSESDVIQCGIPDSVMSPVGWKIYYILNLLAVYLIPILIISVCYAAIVVIIWKKSNFKFSDSQLSCESASMYNSNSTAPRDRSGQQNRRHTLSKAKIKSVIMTFSIVLAFILAWSPYFIYNCLSMFGHIGYNFVTGTVFQIIAPLNSAVNPIIFLLFNTKEYRRSCTRRDTGTTNLTVLHDQRTHSTEYTNKMHS